MQKGLFSVFIIVFGLALGLAKAQIRQPNKGGNIIDYSYTSPKEYEIGGITVTGVKFLDANALITISGLNVGDKLMLPSEKIGLAIKKLWDQGILGDIEIAVTKVEGKYVFLEYRLKERPRLSKFSFKGTKKGETDDLREKIHLIRGRVVTDALIKNTQSTVKKFFIEKGYQNCEVNIVQNIDSAKTSTVSLRIDVKKGRRIKIRDLIFNGNEKVSELTLRRKMKETKEKRWYRFFKASRFIRSNFEKDKEAIIAYYQKEGYRDAEFLSDSIAQVRPGEIDVYINMHEGPKYYFRNITWVGNHIYSSKVLNDLLAIKKGDIYNRESLERKLAFNPNGTDLSSLYQDDGYLFSNIDPVEVSVENDSVDIEMRVYEGPQATINKVSVSGNFKTNDHVILREIRTLPGQKYSRADVVRTIRELSQLGFFDPEQIQPNPVPNPNNGTVDINYSVVERSNDQIELSGGWGGFFGFVGTLGVSFNNFSTRKIPKFREWNPVPGGDGQRLAIRFQANGRQFQTYSFNFTEPWLGGKRPNALSIGFSHSVQNALRGGFSRLQVSNLNVGLGRRLRWPDDYFIMQNTIQLQRYILDNFSFIQGSTFNTGVATNLSLINTFSRNSINNPTFPSSGSNLSLAVTLTPPWSLMRKDNTFETDAERYRLIEYHKWMFDGSWFTGLAPKLVIATRAHMGFIGTYNPKLGYGPFERFRVGGDGITGFNFLLGYDIIGLRGYPNNSIVPNNGVQAGIVYNKFVTELRYALSTNPQATIFTLAFLEGGNNWGSYREFAPFNIYRSAGVGVRIFMPAFGMIGVDWGYGFDRLPGQATRSGANFHFTIGQQIR